MTYDYVGKLGLRMTDSYISGFLLDTPVKSFVSRIKAVNKDAIVTVKDGSGRVVAEDSRIGTGQMLTIQDAAGTYTYTCVVYGDADGDGRIAATDLLAVKNHILEKKTLSGAYIRAVQFSSKAIGATTLLSIKNHILGTAPIVQK